MDWNKVRYAVMRSSVAWGILATLAFFGLLYLRVPEALIGKNAQDFLLRYCAGHPINATEVGLFFVGIAALFIKRRDVVRQMADVAAVFWDPEQPVAAGLDADAKASCLLSDLEKLPYAPQQSYLVQRLRAALTYIRQKGSAEGLDGELKHLAEADSGRMYNSFALSRLTVWAVPILGFLGTVVGITLAIANLDPASLETSMDDVVAALGVAFDTTALALVLSMLQMFLHFSVERRENRLLELVEQRVASELLGSFPESGASHDPQVAGMRRLGEEMLKSTERLVQTQAELWQRSLDDAGTRWSQTAAGAEQILERALEGALTKGLEQHAAHVAASTRQLGEINQKHWQQVEQAMASGVQSSLELQAEMVRQGHMLQQVIHSLGQVVKLEDALHRNLSALSGAHNFEETLASLAAVIHLLNARLAHLPLTQGMASDGGKLGLGRAA